MKITKSKISRRRLLKSTLATAGLTFLQRKSLTAPISSESFVDPSTVEQIADRDPALKLPILIDLQTHVWWRAGGIRRMNERADAFLKSLAGARSGIVGKQVKVADMGRVMFIEDMFLRSDTDLAFLNSFGMKAAFDGVDLFPPREAALIRSMAPKRVRILGCVDPPDGQSAVDSLTYQCEQLKINGLKLYPPGPDTRGWRMDDEKLTYPLYAVLRKHGIKNVCVHKGFPGSFLEPGCHPEDMTRAAADWPDLNFIAFHSAYPFEAELAEQAKKAKVKNIYAEMGLLAGILRTNPERYAKCMGTLLDGLGPDHILWGTDTPVIGPPHWQVQAFQAFTMPDQMIERNKFMQVTPEIKRKIFGENVARLFNIDIKQTRAEVESDLLYRLKDDEKPLPVTVEPPKKKK